MFGNSRLTKELPINLYPSNCSPISQEIFLADNLSIAIPNNVFSAGNVIRLGFNFKMPIEIDTSFPLKFNLSFIGSTGATGNVNWNLRYTYSAMGTGLYLNPNDTQVNPNPNIKIVSKITSISTNNCDLRETICLDIHHIPANPSSSDKYIFYGTLERDATSITDTYLGNIILAMCDCNYVVWCNGGHLLGF